jgi:hypothetical protein
MIEAAAEPCRSERQLMGESTVTGFEPLGRFVERPVQASAAFRLQANRQSSLATRASLAQSSIPVIGDDGTAISREGIRPAR